MASKGGSSIGMVFVMSIVAFCAIAWSVNNPRDARNLVDECISAGDRTLVAVQDFINSGKEK